MSWSRASCTEEPASLKDVPFVLRERVWRLLSGRVVAASSSEGIEGIERTTWCHSHPKTDLGLYRGPRTNGATFLVIVSSCR